MTACSPFSLVPPSSVNRAVLNGKNIFLMYAPLNTWMEKATGPVPEEAKKREERENAFPISC